MAKSIEPRGTWEFIFPEDRELPPEDPNRTVWVLRTLTPTQTAHLQDIAGVVVDNEFLMRTGTVVLEALRAGLVGWRCFRDSNGEELVPQIKDGKITDDSIAYIAPADRQRLAEAITERGQLDEDTAKKS